MQDETLLRRFRLCRADIVATLGSNTLPPSPQSLRLLADLQLAIMATEAAIGDKTDPQFDYQSVREVAA
jgi:hypothetical protein